MEAIVTVEHGFLLPILIMYSILFVVWQRDVKVIILSINALLRVTLKKVLIGR